jgi:hypothetical protein
VHRKPPLDLPESVKQPSCARKPEQSTDSCIMAKYTELTNNILTEEIQLSTYEERARKLEIHSMLRNKDCNIR